MKRTSSFAICLLLLLFAVNSFASEYADSSTDSSSIELAGLLGQTLSQAGTILDLSSLEKRSDTTYLFKEETIEGVIHGYTLVLDGTGVINRIIVNTQNDHYTILGIHPGMTVGDTMQILEQEGYYFSSAGSTNGDLSIWVGYVKDNDQVSFVTSQHGTHGSVTVESQVDRDALVQTIGIRDYVRDAAADSAPTPTFTPAPTPASAFVPTPTPIRSAASAPSTPTSSNGVGTTKSSFYGIWCGASKAYTEAQEIAGYISSLGFRGQVFNTADWENLNSEPWYVVTAGTYSSETEAYDALAAVRPYYPDAYVKYSGSHVGQGSSSFGRGGSSVSAGSSHVGQGSMKNAPSPFYGIWCSASKTYDDLVSEANFFSSLGFPGKIYTTTDWSNLNTEFWYVVSAGTYSTESEAYRALATIQQYYPDSYVKYSGFYQGR